MIADVNLAEMLASAGKAETPSHTEPAGQGEIGNMITIARREMDDGVHWIVNGEDKGVIYSRNNTKQAWILDTLYEGIGRGWIEHPLFIKHMKWTEKEYFGDTCHGGNMQKQLNRMRRKLGVEIEYRKKEGVRFVDGVIRVR